MSLALTRAAFLGNQVEHLHSSRTLLDELLTKGAILQELGHHQACSEKHKQETQRK